MVSGLMLNSDGAKFVDCIELGQWKSWQAQNI